MKNVFLAIAVASYLQEASSRLESEERLDVDCVMRDAWNLAHEDSSEDVMWVLDWTFGCVGVDNSLFPRLFLGRQPPGFSWR